MQRQPVTQAFYRRCPPHWQVEGGHYFVTLRQAGSLPLAAVERLRKLTQEYLELDQPPALQARIYSDLQKSLHTMRGRADLNRPHIASCLMNAIAFRARQGVWDMISYVIMPNHVHLFFRLGDGSLRDVMISFKH
jgi:hypothetical protein